MLLFLFAGFLGFLFMQVIQQFYINLSKSKILIIRLTLFIVPLSVLTLIVIGVSDLFGTQYIDSPESTRAVLGFLAGILLHAFPNWNQTWGTDGVRTWWLLSLSGGILVIFLIALLLPYGPAMFGRMSKFAVGAADVEFATSGAEKQLLLAGDRDLSDTASLMGTIEVPFIQYECGLAALKAGSLEAFKHPKNYTYTPSYQDFQHAIWFRTKSPIQTLVFGVLNARKEGYGTEELRDFIKPVAEEFAHLLDLYAKWPGDFDEYYDDVFAPDVHQALSQLWREGVSTEAPPEPPEEDNPHWCKPKQIESTMVLKQLIANTRYVHDLASALLGFVGSPERAIAMAKRASDAISDLSSEQKKCNGNECARCVRRTVVLRAARGARNISFI